MQSKISLSIIKYIIRKPFKGFFAYLYLHQQHARLLQKPLIEQNFLLSQFEKYKSLNFYFENKNISTMKIAQHIRQINRQTSSLVLNKSAHKKQLRDTRNNEYASCTQRHR